MTAKEAYGKLYRGVLRELTKWADDELVGVYKLAKADAHSEISKLIKAELARRAAQKKASWRSKETHSGTYR